jgi:hypothetical protein
MGQELWPLSLASNPVRSSDPNVTKGKEFQRPSSGLNDLWLIVHVGQTMRWTRYILPWSSPSRFRNWCNTDWRNDARGSWVRRSLNRARKNNCRNAERAEDSSAQARDRESGPSSDNLPTRCRRGRRTPTNVTGDGQAFPPIGSTGGNPTCHKFCFVFHKYMIGARSNIWHTSRHKYARHHSQILSWLQLQQIWYNMP